MTDRNDDEAAGGEGAGRPGLSERDALSLDEFERKPQLVRDFTAAVATGRSPVCASTAPAGAARATPSSANWIA